jgi:hypothetical protein
VRIVTIAPIVVTVELSPTDCIALAEACMYRIAGWDDGHASALLETTAAALLAAMLAAADPGMDETPTTIAKVWRVWAPLVCLHYPHYGRLPVPPEYAD